MSVRSRAAGTRARAKAYAERVEAIAPGSRHASTRSSDRRPGQRDRRRAHGRLARLPALHLAAAVRARDRRRASASRPTPRTRRRRARHGRSGSRGVIASSVAEASRGTSRWYAIAIGIPILIWASRGLLRALVVVHRLVWGDPRHVVPKATLLSTFRFLGMFVLYFLLRELASNVGAWTGSFVLKTLVGLVSMFGWWLLVSLQLPHAGHLVAGARPGRDPRGGRARAALGRRHLPDRHPRGQQPEHVRGARRRGRAAVRRSSSSAGSWSPRRSSTRRSGTAGAGPTERDRCCRD